jgi:tetratricopeptide (TPR) repeat protein
MGEVYRAKDTRLSRQVAIKVLLGHLAADAVARARLRLEAMAAAGLDHPYICKVFEIAEDCDTLFLVMEFIAGDTLHQRLRSGTLPLAEALRIAGEVAEALEEAHNKRLVHRDLKPANVMLTQGHVKVMDFGLARRFAVTELAGDDPTPAPVPALTEVGTIVGTPDYMSPEQVKGQPLDGRSDVFSFGVLLCALLGNPSPFRRTTTQETMAAILRDPPELSGDLPPGLMLLIRRLLQKSPEDRYQSMAEVRADLAGLATAAMAPEPARQVQEDRIPLIGREKEFAELKRCLTEALAGRGSLVMIGGEPGIGKTHLITALLDEARRRGAYTNIGHCYEMEGSPPYVPFIEMLERTAQTAPKAGFRLALGDAASEIAKLMPELRRMYPDIPPAIQLPPEQQRRYLYNAYREFIERGARSTPIVHVFEDLHWADEPTLLLLQHIVQILSSAPILIIGTYRDVELEVTRPFAKTLEALMRQKQATRISLRRLAVDGVESMLAAMSGQTPPPSLARVVFAETEGNPFFVEEIFRHLAEEGKLFDETGKWRPGLRVDQLQVPEGVRLVLGRRLDRLGADARRVLTTAAVIGRSFSLRLLEALENAQPDAALDAVEEAERAHLVSVEPATGREMRYRFVHELVRQTLAETLSLPRRQRLHARVADAIERMYAANLEAQASQLAHHLYQAGAAVDPEKASAYLMMAAQKARAGAAHEEALAHIENALSLWEGEESLRVGELTLQRAEALRSLGRMDEAIDNSGKAIAMFETAGAVARMADASFFLSDIQGWRQDFSAGNRTIDRALERLGSEETGLRLKLLSQRAALAMGSGDLAGAVAQRAALGTTEDFGAVILYFSSMQFEKAAAVARRVAESCRERGDLWSAANVEFACLSVIYCGSTAEAAADLPGAMQLAEKVGHRNALSAIKWISILLAASRGDLRQAEREAEEAWNFGEQHLASNFLSDTMRGTVAYLRGNLSEAERWFRYRQESQTFYFGAKDAGLFALLAESHDARAAQAWTERRWNLPKPGQLNTVGAWIALERSVVGLGSMGMREEAAAWRPLTEELVRTGVWVHRNMSPMRTAAGIAAACAGAWSAAEEHHLIAIHQTDTAPYRVSQPIAREWYAQMLLDRNAAGDRAKARGLLSEVLAMYESMEMPFHANRTSGRLASL